jgi:hypothetical protein
MTPSRLVRINFSEELSNSEGACLSETSILTCQISRCRILEDNNMDIFLVGYVAAWFYVFRILMFFATKIADIRLTKLSRLTSVCSDHIAILLLVIVIIATLYLVRISTGMPVLWLTFLLALHSSCRHKMGRARVHQSGLPPLPSESFPVRDSSSNYPTLYSSY